MIILAGPRVVEEAIEAEKKGFDAVVPYGNLDLGVDAARSQADNQVVGMDRSGFCMIWYANPGRPRVWSRPA